jgi:hypothetical protein
MTPPRGRHPTARGRVPLHRRGTSKTYETLEDLLREAGYKETKIFTPERDGVEAEAEERVSMLDGGRGVAAGVGTVVGFLAGLIPGSRNTGLQREATLPDDLETPRVSRRRRHKDSPPPSPLACKQAQKRATLNDSLPESSLSRTTTRSSAAYSPDYLPPLHRNELRYPRLHPYAQDSRPQLASYPRAHAYLRHVASAPSMGKSLSEVATGKRRATAAMEDDEPPLPQTWLGNVARAVLFGGSSTHLGGPSSNPQRGRSGKVKMSLRQPHAFLTDRTNIAHGTNLVNPCARIQNTRSRRSEGEVSKTRVVCRSAPGSRSGSRVRGREGRRLDGQGAWAGLGINIGADGEREKSNQGKWRQLRRRRIQRAKEKDGLPILARITVEDDGHVMSNRGRHFGSLTSWEDGSEMSDSEEEDEGELDLAKMLVPPKRQNSIRSLRKHLSTENYIDKGSLTESLRRKWLGNDSEGTGIGKDVWGTLERGQSGPRRAVDDDEVLNSMWVGGASRRQRRGIPTFGI